MSGTPTTIQVLYHINFGTPWIDAGAQLIAPAATVVFTVLAIVIEP